MGRTMAFFKLATKFIAHGLSFLTWDRYLSQNLKVDLSNGTTKFGVKKLLTFAKLFVKVRQFFSAEFGQDKMTKGKNIFSFEKALCFFHVETHSGKNVQQCMQNLN